MLKHDLIEDAPVSEKNLTIFRVKLADFIYCI